jgi:hypothetical protein
MVRSLIIVALVIVSVIIGVMVFTRSASTSNHYICCDTTYKSCAACCPSDKPVWKDDGSNDGLGSCWEVGKCPMSGGMCYPCSQLTPCN